jgi:GNAT superfamily N-acetyltransferase
VRRRPPVRIRPYGPGDEGVLDAVFAGMSATSRRRRYQAAVPELAASVRAALTAVDGVRHVAYVAEAGRGRGRHPIGVARYVVDRPGGAELAYEVVDAWHGRGVGTRLVGALIGAARAAGLDELHATVLPENEASLAVLRRHLPTARTRLVEGLLEISARLTSSTLTTEDLLDDLRVA